VSRPRRAAPALLLGGAVLVLLARLSGAPGTPPLYDSFTQPDAYRYLHPAGGERGSPGSASKTVPYTGADPGPLTLATGPDENPPQAQLLLGAGSLSVSPGAQSITLSIKAVDTPAARPPNGVVVGNTYRYSAVAGAALGLTAGHPATLVLRGPTGTGSATVDEYDGRTWTPLTTSPIAGPDIFAANTMRFGDVALVAPEAHVASGGFPWLPWVAGAAVVLLAAGEAAFLLLAGRRGRQRR
jgi:hypothetical protein